MSVMLFRSGHMHVVDYDDDDDVGWKRDATIVFTLDSNNNNSNPIHVALFTPG